VLILGENSIVGLEAILFKKSVVTIGIVNLVPYL